MQNHDDPPGRPPLGSHVPSTDNRTREGTDLRDELAEAAGDAKARAKEQGEHYRDLAADKADAVADSARAAAGQLGDDAFGAELSRHITDLADGMSRFSAALRDKSVDEVVRDLRDTAREHPALFLAGSVALGFGISRFAQASSRASGSRGSSGEAGRATSRSGRPDPGVGVSVRGAEAASVPRDESGALRSGATPDLAGDSATRARQAFAADAADRHPRPPYGAPNPEDHHE